MEGNFRNVIHTPESKRVFFSTIEHFYMEEKDCPAVGQFTYISPKVKLGKNVRIGHNCTLDGDITIGDNTIIWNHVTLLNRVSVGQVKYSPVQISGMMVLPTRKMRTIRKPW